MESSEDKIKYIDGQLRGFPYSSRKVAEMMDRIQLIEYEMQGTIKSPVIKSKEQAFYKQSPPVYHNRYAELEEERERCLEDLDRYVKSMREIAAFLQTLSSREVRLLSMRYEQGLTFETIGRRTYTTKANAMKKIRRILDKF